MDVDLDRLLHASALPLMAVLATFRARVDARHRVLAAMFWAVAASDMLRSLLDPALDTGAFPYRSAALDAAYHADNASFLVGSLGTVLAMFVHFAGVPVRWVVAGWLGTAVGFVVWKETTLLPSVEFHRWVAIVAVLLGSGLVARAALAPPERFVRPDTVHMVLALLLCCDIVHVTVFRIDGLLDAWPVLRAMNLTVYAVIILTYAALYARDWRARWSPRRT